MRASVLTALAAVAVTALGCPPPDAKPPDWAKVSSAQVEEAKRLGVPVAFENKIGMKFVLIPPGKFSMGKPEDRFAPRKQEIEHRVEITKAYYLAIHETTNAAYRRFKPGHKGEGVRFSKDPAIWDGDKQPATPVSHDDACKFIAWLNREDRGRTYRLPTEAEWEYACRAGTDTQFSFGDTISTDQANYNGSAHPYGEGKIGVYREVTTAVGSFPPNAWGLYDMHGNVCEWCADWYDEDYYEKSPLQDPPGPKSSPEGQRVLRGGSWIGWTHECRSGSRYWGDPKESAGFAGFRVAVSVPPK